VALGDGDVAALLDREREDRLAAASEFTRLGQAERAARMSVEAEIVARYRAA
jgi:hypothetical protein